MDKIQSQYVRQYVSQYVSPYVSQYVSQSFAHLSRIVFLTLMDTKVFAFASVTVVIPSA